MMVKQSKELQYVNNNSNIRMSCGRKYCMGFIENFTLFPAVKNVRKLVNTIITATKR